MRLKDQYLHGKLFAVAYGTMIIPKYGLLRPQQIDGHEYLSSGIQPNSFHRLLSVFSGVLLSVWSCLFCGLIEVIIPHWACPSRKLSFNDNRTFDIVHSIQMHAYVAYYIRHTQQTFRHEFHILIFLQKSKKTHYSTPLIFPSLRSKLVRTQLADLIPSTSTTQMIQQERLHCSFLIPNRGGFYSQTYLLC